MSADHQLRPQRRYYPLRQAFVGNPDRLEPGTLATSHEASPSLTDGIPLWQIRRRVPSGISSCLPD